MTSQMAYLAEQHEARCKKCLDGHEELVAALRDMTRIAKAASIGVTGNQPRIAKAEAALAKASAP